MAAMAQLARRLCLMLALFASGCSSLLVTDTKPLSPDQLEPKGAENISRRGYRLANLSLSSDTPDLLMMVALSGGGKRSASFGWGVLQGMRDVTVQTVNGPRSLLDQVDAISGVSGGSFPAAYYGLYGRDGFGRFETDFLYQDTNSTIFGIYLLPWHWAWLVQPGIGTNDFMDHAYDKAMFHGATYEDLLRRGRPLVVVGATDIATGRPFLFIQNTFDLLCSDLSAFPISRAIAASNGFPGLFSPITLTSHAAACDGRRPGLLRRITPAEKQDPLSRVGVEAMWAERYLDPNRTRYVHLSDGGVADNLAMRTAGSLISAVAATPGQLQALGYARIRRLLVVSVDGQSAQDTTVSQRKEVGGLFAMFGLVSGAQIDNYNFETLSLMVDQLRQARTALQTVRCATAPVIDGARCDDVEATLVRISLRELPDGPEKDHLQAIPTGLTVQRSDVDLLIKAGHDAVIASQPLHAFLDNYLPAPPPLRRRRAPTTDQSAAIRPADPGKQANVRNVPPGP